MQQRQLNVSIAMHTIELQDMKTTETGNSQQLVARFVPCLNNERRSGSDPAN